MKTTFFWFVSVVLLFFGVNQCTPYMNDDIEYMHMANSEGWFDLSREINSFADLLESQFNHYLSFNGRTIVHVLVQFFCCFVPKNIYNFFAAGLWGLFIFLLGAFCKPNGTNKQKITYGIVATTILLLLSSEPTAYYEGISYGMNYLFPPVVVLGYVWLFCHSVNTHSNMLNVFLCILGFLAGWSHEGLVVGVSVGLFFWIIKNNNAITKMQLISFSLFVIGACLLILCPANFNRISEAPGTLLQRLIKFPTWINTILLLLIVFFSIKDRKKIEKLITENLLIFISWIVMLPFLLYIQRDGRSFLGVELFGVVLLIRIIDKTICTEKRMNHVLYWGSITQILIWACVIYYQRSLVKDYDQVLNKFKDETYINELICYPSLGQPDYLDRFVCRHDCERAYWYDKCYEKKWKNKYTFDGDESALTNMFDKNYKEPGENPFYRHGPWLYTNITQPEQVRLSLSCGKYQVGWKLVDMLYYLRNLYIDEKNVEIEVEVQEIHYHDNLLYRVYLPTETSRKITRVDVL